MNIYKKAKKPVYRSRKLIRTSVLTACLLCICLYLPDAVFSQMFSVQEQREFVITPERVIKAGLVSANFDYRGPSDLNLTARDFSFSAPLYNLGIVTENFEGYAIFGRNLGENDNSYTEFGARVKGGVFIVPGQAFSVILPLILSTDYVVATNRGLTNNINEFKQNNVGVYSGLEIRAKLGDKSRFVATGIGGIHYSVAGYGISAGTAVDWSVANNLYFDRVFGNIGIKTGFKIGARKYTIEDRSFNYNMSNQSIVLGITF
jgi:hypothetical protein